MEKTIDKRRIPREEITNAKLRVYTSFTRVPYTVEIDNITKKGAFVKTKFLPKRDETISFEAINSDFTNFHTGNAKVKWIEEERNGNSGFGIEFENDFPVNEFN